MKNRVFVRGDAHGDFSWLPEWTILNSTTENDILILLGDSALRFEDADNWREKNRKRIVSKCPITVFVVRGNHDRPFTEETRQDVELVECPLLDEGENHNIKMWHDKEYPNIWYFNEDDPIYYICEHRFLILPGAYSVDKEYRLMMGWTWYNDEQLTREQQLDYMDRVDHLSFDFVLSHTCPLCWQPVDLFMRGLDQSKVDSSTEEWLEEILELIGYKQWFFGHYHANRDNGNNGNYDWHGTSTMLLDEIRQII